MTHNYSDRVRWDGAFCPPDSTRLVNTKHCTSPQLHHLHFVPQWWQHHHCVCFSAAGPGGFQKLKAEINVAKY